MSTARPNHDSRAQQTLQINNEVEPPLSQIGKESQIAYRCQPITFSGCIAVKGNDLVKFRMALKQWRISAIDDPRNVRFGKSLTQSAEHRQTVHDITQRARLDEGD